VPLSMLFGFIGDLRTISSGRATYSMEFDHNEVVPRNIQDEIMSVKSDKKAA